MDNSRRLFFFSRPLFSAPLLFSLSLLRVKGPVNGCFSYPSHVPFAVNLEGAWSLFGPRNDSGHLLFVSVLLVISLFIFVFQSAWFPAETALSCRLFLVFSLLFSFFRPPVSFLCPESLPVKAHSQGKAQSFSFFCLLRTFHPLSRSGAFPLSFLTKLAQNG